MKLVNLEKCFNAAIKENAKYIGVKIETRGSEGAEIIVNPTCNFENKLVYYKKAYTEDLVLKTYDGIIITGFTYADTLKGIETDLIEADENPNMNFNTALELLKQGIKVAREGWNDAGIEGYLCINENCIEMNMYGRCTPWYASSTDMLSEDWVIIE